MLVVGGGGREHALVRALRRSPRRPQVLCAPGNAGIAAEVPCLDVDAGELDRLVAAAVDRRCDLVVIGPEAPLVAGLADALAGAGVGAFGPSAAAARIEGSKAYAKQLMRDLGVPTAGHTLLRTEEEARGQLPCASYPAVLKADGLAAGKGVVICATEAQAREAVDHFFVERRFGDTSVVLEEFIEGDELSLLALCDGERAVPLAPARDYKRIGEGGSGPNTGGMGSFSPVPEVDGDRADELVGLFHQPIVDELRRRGTPYHGVLYAGLMLTAAGPKVLEYNCRLGDPETQAVLPRLRSDLLGLMERCVRHGGLAGVEVEWSPEWAVTVVLAAAGYPAAPVTGERIEGLDAVDLPGVEVTHAGTRRVGDDVVTSGGRVLGVTGLGATAGAARDVAYRAAERITFPGRQMRADIAVAVTEEVRA